MAKLTDKQIGEILSKQYEKEVVKLKIGGKSYEFTYDKVYTPVGIENAVRELMEFNEYAMTNEISDYNTYTGVPLQILKQFTSFPFKTKGNTKARFDDLINKSYAAKNMISDSGKSVFDELLEVAGNENEIRKITDKIKQMIDNVKSITEDIVSEEDESNDNV